MLDNNNYYVVNLETNKIELHFEKSRYISLSDAEKNEIKSACLFSRYASAWVSRGYVGSYSASKVKQIAERLGLEDAGKEGDKLSFAERQERKAERAEMRAERYEVRADAATARGEALQRPIENMRGDIAFFTQPNINSSAGRAFTNKRNRMWAAWENGFEEFKKSEYYIERAKTARATAAGCKMQSIDFCERRIKECNHDIKILVKNLDNYKKVLDKINAGESVKYGYSGMLTAADVARVEEWIENAADRLDSAVDKCEYYQAMIDAQGGQKYTAENINVGDVVRTVRRYYGEITVTRKGPKNFSGVSGANNWPCSFSYAEITEVVKKQEGPLECKHGFKAGDVYPVKCWNDETHKYEEGTVEIVKVSPEKATVKINSGRAKSLSIRDSYNGGYYIPVNTSAPGHVEHFEWLYAKTATAAT